jgi:hypothetical protein
VFSEGIPFLGLAYQSALRSSCRGVLFLCSFGGSPGQEIENMVDFLCKARRLPLLFANEGFLMLNLFATLRSETQ